MYLHRIPNVTYNHHGKHIIVTPNISRDKRDIYLATFFSLLSYYKCTLYMYHRIICILYLHKEMNGMVDMETSWYYFNGVYFFLQWRQQPLCCKNRIRKYWIRKSTLMNNLFTSHMVIFGHMLIKKIMLQNKSSDSLFS